MTIEELTLTYVSGLLDEAAVKVLIRTHLF